MDLDCFLRSAFSVRRRQAGTRLARTLVEDGQQRLDVGLDLGGAGGLPEVEIAGRRDNAGIPGIQTGQHIVPPQTLGVRPPVQVDDTARPMIHGRVYPSARAMDRCVRLWPPARSGGLRWRQQNARSMVGGGAAFRCGLLVGLRGLGRGEVRWGSGVAEGVRIRLKLRMRCGSSAMDTSAWAQGWGGLGRRTRSCDEYGRPLSGRVSGQRDGRRPFVAPSVQLRWMGSGDRLRVGSHARWKSSCAHSRWSGESVGHCEPGIAMLGRRQNASRRMERGKVRLKRGLQLVVLAPHWPADGQCGMQFGRTTASSSRDGRRQG